MQVTNAKELKRVIQCLLVLQRIELKKYSKIKCVILYKKEKIHKKKDEEEEEKRKIVLASYNGVSYIELLQFFLFPIVVLVVVVAVAFL